LKANAFGAVTQSMCHYAV